MAAAAPIFGETLEVELVPLERVPSSTWPVALGIATGDDGNLWFTAPNRGAIGRMRSDRHVDYFPLAPRGSEAAYATSIIAGTDGLLWFVLPYWQTVGRITTAGEPLPPITVRVTSNFVDEPVDIALTADGAVWARPRYSNWVHRVDAAGNGQTFTLAPGRIVTAIATGPDGELWFAAEGEIDVTRVSADGTMRAFPVGVRPGVSAIAAMSAVAGEALWFVDWHSDRFSRVTPLGRVTGLLLEPDAPRPIQVVPDHQGNVWYVGETPGGIVRTTPRGDVDAYSLPSHAPRGMTFAADGHFWITDITEDHLLRVTLPPTPGPAPSPRPIPERAYAASQFDGVITPIDLSPLRVHGAFDVTREAFSLSDVQISHDARLIYAILGYAVQVFDLRSGRLVRTIPAPGWGMEISPDGSLAHLAVAGTEGGLVEVDLRKWEITRGIELGCVVVSAWSPDGATAYAVRLPRICDPDSDMPDDVAVVDVGRGALTDTIPIAGAGRLSASRDGKRLYVPADLSELIRGLHGFVVVDVATKAVVGTVRTPVDEVKKIIVSTDDRLLYVLTTNGRVHTIEASTLEIRSTIELSRFAFPSDAELHPDGRRLYVLDYGGNLIEIDLLEQRVVDEVGPLPYEPVEIALAIPPPLEPCRGDCDASGSVRIEDLVRAVRAALDATSVDCESADADADGRVTINELIIAVNAVLFGCSDA